MAERHSTKGVVCLSVDAFWWFGIVQEDQMNIHLLLKGIKHLMIAVILDVIARPSICSLHTYHMH